MKRMLGWLVLAVCVTGAQGAQVRCQSKVGDTIRLDIRKGRLPATLEGEHIYNEGTSRVLLACDKTSKIVASAVRYFCTDLTYGVSYARLTLSPLAFQGSRRFPLKVEYLDENTDETVSTRGYDCRR